MSHNAHVTFSFDDLIWSDLNLDLYLVGIRPNLICYLLHPLGSILADVGFSDIISPVSVADKAKHDDFDLI